MRLGVIHHWCCALVLLVFAAGCGAQPAEDLPELGQVSGKVTLDSTPVAGALVTFQPTGEGAISTGFTDEEGNYTLQYNVSTTGAVLGTHTVSISKPDGDGGPEMLPAKYNLQTSLSTTVDQGENTADFPLTSK